MSSLAASRADNFYYPPEWEPSMGGISKFQGSKGKNQYEQFGIIRFELPFDAWCLKCGLHMSKGLRFNAKKDKDGQYFSTTIWSFSMKCFDCSEPFIIKTNPKDNTYDFVAGLRKHEQEYEIGEEEGVVSLSTDEHRLQLTKDPMFRLQHNEQDKAKAKSVTQNLADLQALQDSVQRKDYDMNSILRRRNRTKKKQELHMKEEGRQRGLAIPLLESSEEDAQKASHVDFHSHRKPGFVASEQRKILAVQSQSIFGKKEAKGLTQVRAVQQLLQHDINVSGLLSSSKVEKKMLPAGVTLLRKRSAKEMNGAS